MSEAAATSFQPTCLATAPGRMDYRPWFAGVGLASVLVAVRYLPSHPFVSILVAHEKRNDAS